MSIGRSCGEEYGLGRLCGRVKALRAQACSACLEPAFPYGHPSLTPQGGRPMVLRKDLVEIGNSG